MTYKIIGTGSSGNAVLVYGDILIDCGVSFKTLNSIYKEVRLVLLTHIHCDHFCTSTVRLLAAERPTLRFGCCAWMLPALLDCKVDPQRIDLYTPGQWMHYGELALCPVDLCHDVPNCGYKIKFGEAESLFYATDTCTLEGVEAKGYGLYMVEANYGKTEIQERISAKRENGAYAYEQKVIQNHLSVEAANDWVYSNMGPHSEYVFLHGHMESNRGS